MNFVQPSYDQNNRIQRLGLLGFAEDDLELIQSMAPNVTDDELVRKYLDIARHQPYNLNWNSVQTAMNAPDGLRVYKPNGVEYIKTDIAKDTVEYFCFGVGGAHRINKKKRRTRKHRSNKRKYRMRKTRHRRRH